MKKTVWGIAGYIGSGKSTVARYLQEQGAFVLDADEVVNELYQPGAEGYRKVVNFFGDEYLDAQGFLKRKKIAREIFSDPKKLKILHMLIHPLVTHTIQKKIDQAPLPWIVIEAVYFEKKYLQKLVTKLLWIEAPKKLLFTRVSKQRSMSRTLFEKIYRVQMKPDHVDVVIVNDSTQKDLKKRVRELILKS